MYFAEIKKCVLELYLLHWHGACVCAQLLSCVRLFVFPWTVAHQILCPYNFPGKNTGVGCCFLFQHIFPAQGSNPCLLPLLHWQVDSLPLCNMGGPLTWKIFTKYYFVKEANYQTVLFYVCIQTDQNKISYARGKTKPLMQNTPILKCSVSKEMKLWKIILCFAWFRLTCFSSKRMLLVLF